MVVAPQAQNRLLEETAETRREMAITFARWTSGNMNKATAIPWFSLFSRTEPTMPHSHIYEPNVAIVLQGRKHVSVGDEVFVYDE